jgi:hypothetical protein
MELNNASKRCRSYGTGKILFANPTQIQSLWDFLQKPDIRFLKHQFKENCTVTPVFRVVIGNACEVLGTVLR